MIAARWLPAGVAKEIRVLLPAWLACTATVAAGGLLDRPQLLGIAMLAFVLGTVTLGVQSIGHEYTHRTLSLLLSLPSDRRRHYVTKTAVLGAMLLVLSTVAWLTLGASVAVRGSIFRDPWVVAIVGLSGLFLAPCLTLICRNPLAAMVFTFSIPGVLLVGGELAGVTMYGLSARREVEAIGLVIFWRGMFIVCALAAVASWILFMRLEASDSRGADLQMPAWWRRSTTTRVEDGRVRSRQRAQPIRLLVKKELRLQQMTFVLVALYVLIWTSLSVVQRSVPELNELPLLPLSILYLGLLSIVIGSLASAEERHLGTLESQALLPIAAWRQWAVKAGTVIGLAVVLGIGMPLLLAQFSSSAEDERIAGKVGELTGLVLVLTSGSLYLSSLSTSGVRAVVLSVPVIFGFVLFLEEAGEIAERLLLLAPFVSMTTTLRPDRAFLSSSVEWLPYILAGGFVALLLRLAMRNHRSTERSAARVGRQMVWIAAYVIFALLVFGTSQAMFHASRLAGS